MDMEAVCGKVYDYVVIGGGSGGIASARRARAHGADVLVVENSRWGGTCVNVGCVPKKIMWWASSVAQTLKEAREYGFNREGSEGSEGSAGTAPKVDWAYLKKRRDASVLRLNGIYSGNLARDEIPALKGTAHFYEDSLSESGVIKIQCDLQDENDLAERDLAASDSKDKVAAAGTGTGNRKVVIKSKNVLIAVGGEPMKLGIPGEEECKVINSDGFFDLEKQPKKAAVIGAGYIAVELAGVLNGLGTETHSLIRGDRVLRKFETVLAEEVTKTMEHHGIVVHRNMKIKQMGRQGKGKGTESSEDLCYIELESGEKIENLDCIIVATGRSPSTKPLQLHYLKGTNSDNSGNSETIEFDRLGHIIVDDYQRTKIPGLHALGDVCGKVPLTPMAIAAGRRLADRLFLKGFEGAKADYDNVPSVVFTHPPLATIGLTSEEAIQKYGEDDIKIYDEKSVNLYYNVFDLTPAQKPKIHLRMICRKSQDYRIIGLHVLGLGADEILQGFAVAIKMGATKADFDSAVAIHPSAAEELVTIPPWGLTPQKCPGDDTKVNTTTTTAGDATA